MKTVFEGVKNYTLPNGVVINYHPGSRRNLTMTVDELDIWLRHRYRTFLYSTYFINTSTVLSIDEILIPLFFNYPRQRFTGNYDISDNYYGIRTFFNRKFMPELDCLLGFGDACLYF